MSCYFVTGIGTGVGKTFSAAVLTEALQADYWKPVQTGLSEGTDTASIKQLITNSRTKCFNEKYSFREPASPHLAAALENAIIDLDQLNLPAYSNRGLIIEGAGGILVPLNNTSFVIDLAKKFNAEVILVCRNYLGCINHSLLSIDFLVKNNFKVKGLILNGDFEPIIKSTITNYAGIPVLAEFPNESVVDRASILRLAKSINLPSFA